MNSKQKGSPCYYCGDPSTSEEHIPPEQLFVGTDASEVTVPSCNLHNERKSFFDEAIIKGFLYSLHEFLETKQLKPEDIHPTIHALIERVKHRFPQVKKLVSKTKMFRDGHDPRGRNLTAVSIDERLDYDGWIKKVTAGWIWDATKQFNPELDWVEGSWVVDNFYVNAENRFEGLTWEELQRFNAYAEKQIGRLEKVTWFEAWSAFPKPYPPELYNFKLAVLGSIGNLCFKHTFLEKYSFYVMIKCPEHIVKKISDHIQTIDVLTDLINGKIPIIKSSVTP